MTFKAPKSLQLILLCLLSTFMLVQSTVPPLNSINSFLKDQIFGGSDRGPCPPDPQGCYYNFPGDLPEGVKTTTVYVDINQRMPFPFSLIKIKIQENMKIEDIVKGGTARFTNVRCSSVVVPDMTVVHSPLTPGPSVDVDPSVKGTVVDKFKAEARTQSMKFNCVGRFDFQNFIVDFTEVGATVTGQGSFTLVVSELDMDIKTVIEVVEVGRSFPNWIEGSGSTMDTTSTAELKLDGSGEKWDRIKDLKCGPVPDILCNNFIGEWVINRPYFTRIVTNIVREVFQETATEVLRQGFRQPNDVAGDINTALDNQQIIWADLFKPYPAENAVTYEAALTNNLDLLKDSPAEFQELYGPKLWKWLDRVDETIDFATSDPFEFLSVGINEYLNETDPVTGKLNYNTFASQLNNGADSVRFNRSELAKQGLSQIDAYDAKMFKINGFADQVVFKGFDSFTRFSILENGFEIGGVPEDRNRWTTNFDLAMNDVDLQINFEVQITEGLWSQTRDAADGENFSFNVEMQVELADIALSGSVLALFDVLQINDVQIGQFLAVEADNLPDKILKSMKCSGDAWLFARVLELGGKVGELRNLKIVTDGLDDESSKVIKDMFQVGYDVLATYVLNEIDNYLRGPIRESANEAIMEDVLKNTLECKSYLPPSDIAKHFSLNPEEGIFYFVKLALDRTFGGTAINKDRVQVNDLVHVFLEYIAATPGFSFNIDSLGNGTWAFTEDLLTLTGNATLGTGETLVRVYDLVVSNTDSIYKLTGSTPTDTSLNLEAGVSRLSDSDGFKPLTVEWTMSVSVDDDNVQVDETMHIIMGIDELELNMVFPNVNINEYDLYSLTVKQATKFLTCWMSTMTDIEMDKALSSLNLKTVRFELGGRTSGASSGDIPLGAALDTLEEELKSSRFPTPQFLSMLNNVLRGEIRQLADNVNAYDTTLNKPATCETATSPLESTFFQGIFNLPLVDDIVREAIIDQPPVPSREILDAQAKLVDDHEAFDWQESTIAGALNKFLSSVDLKTFEEIAIQIANTTGNDLSAQLELETLETGEEVISFFYPLNNLTGGYENEENIPGLHITAGEFRLQRLNQFRSLFLFKDPSQFVTSHGVQYGVDRDPVEGFATYQILLEPSFTGLDYTIQDNITFDFQVKGLELELMTLVAFDVDVLSNLTLGHFVSVSPDQKFYMADQYIDCALTGVFESGASLPQSRVSFQEINGPYLRSYTSEIFSDGLKQTLEASVDILARLYVDEIPDLTQGYMRRKLNEGISNRKAAVVADPSLCIDPPPPIMNPESQILDYSTLDQLVTFQEFFDKYLRQDNFGLLNQVIKSVFTGDANPYFVDDPLEFGDIELLYNAFDYGKMTVKFSELVFRNVHNITALDFLKPLDEHTLRTQIKLKSADPNGDAEISFRVYFQVDGFFNAPKTNNVITNDLRVTLKFKEMQFLSDVLTAVDVALLMDMPLGSINSFDKIACLLRAVRQLDIQTFDINFKNATSYITCESGECDSPLLQPLNYGDGGDQEDGSQDLTPFINAVVDLMEGLVRSNAVTNLIDRTLFTANETCAIISGIELIYPERETRDVAEILGIAFMGIAGLGIFIVLAYIPVHIMRRARAVDDELLRNAVVIDASGNMTLKDNLDFQALGDKMDVTKTHMRSMFGHPAVPAMAMYMVPVVALLNIVFLIYAVGFAQATAVEVYVTFLGSESAQGVALVPFTIASTINDFWNSGAWPVAILVAILSVGWPVAKNAMLVYIWFAPETVIGPQRRGKVINILDSLGKWSFLDVFVIVLMLAGLKLYISLSFNAYFAALDEDFINFAVNVTPQDGIVLLATVVCSSLLVNHVILFYHSRMIQMNKVLVEGIEKRRFRLAPSELKLTRTALHVFAGRNQRGDRVRITHTSQVLLVVGLMISMLGLAIGMFVPVLRFEFQGLIGLVLREIDGGEDLSVREYTLISLGTILGESTNKTSLDYFVILLFQSLYFLTVVVAPLLYPLFVIILWLVPFRRNTRKVMYAMANLASHWSSVEVFLLGIVLMIFEVRSITSYILDFVTDDTCTAIRSYLQELFGPKDGLCFDVIASLLPGTMLVVASSALQIFTCKWVVTLTKAAIDDVDYVCEIERGVPDWKPPGMGRAARLVVRISTTAVSEFKQFNNGPNGEGGSAGESDNPTFGSYFNTVASKMNGAGTHGGGGGSQGSSFGMQNPSNHQPHHQQQRMGQNSMMQQQISSDI